jgi:hypothetical protein
MNGEKINLKTKNIKFDFNGNNFFTMNNKIIFAILTVANFESAYNFGFDFIKAQRINRIYREYIIDKMNEAFNSNS